MSLEITDTLTAIIADDEPVALDVMRHRLSQASVPVKILGEATSGREALDLIRRMRPDIAFLDIQMPPPNGLEIAEILADTVKTRFVFVTAFDSHAIDAFKVSAADYLLKPVEEARINVTLSKLQIQTTQEQQLQAVQTLLKSLHTKQTQQEPQKECLSIKDGATKRILSIENISYIQVSGDYASIYYDDKRAFVRETLSSLLNHLPNETFVQIHRSAVVNIHYIKAVENSGNSCIIEKNNGQKLNVSRSRKAGLMKLV